MRAATEGTDNAMCYEVCATLEEAKNAVKESWLEGVIFSYKIHENEIRIDGHIQKLEDLFEDEHLESVMSWAR